MPDHLLGTARPARRPVHSQPGLVLLDHIVAERIPQPQPLDRRIRERRPRQYHEADQDRDNRSDDRPHGTCSESRRSFPAIVRAQVRLQFESRTKLVYMNDVSRALLRSVRPMLATSASALPRGSEWTYEVKWDGYRALALKHAERVTLMSRNLKDLTAQYPSAVSSLRGIRASAALIDGEIVALDENGRPSFQSLHHQSAHTVVYYAFDLLHLDGADLFRSPLDERRAALADLLNGTRVLLSEPLPGTPAQIEQAVRGLGLEGVIAKRRASIYEPGKRSGAWIKVKFNQRQELVVGGFKPGGGDFESLLVGYYSGRRLYYAGKVRAGLTPHLRSEIFRRIAKDQRPRCPFVNLPSTGASHWGEGITADDMAKLRWVDPRLVVEVSFVEWTRDGNLRHAQFVAVRDDKPPREVTRDSS
jgi:bifunctional non-homologous end joining protein LigD